MTRSVSQAVEKDLLPACRELPQFAAALEALRDRAVVDVAQIHGMFDLVAATFEVASQHVGEDYPAAESQVGQSVQARTAGVDRDLARRDQLQVLRLAQQRIVEPQRLGRRLGNEQRGGKVPLAAVGQQGHDGALPQRPGLIHGHFHGGPGAHAHKEPFFPRQPPGRLIGRLVVHVDDGVQLVRLEDPRRVTLLHVLQALDLVDLEGFDADDADLRVEFSQGAGRTHHRARGAHGNHDDVDFAAGGLPNLLARALVVRFPVGIVVELVDQHVLVGFLAGQAIGLFDGPVGAAGPASGGSAPHRPAESACAPRWPTRSSSREAGSP